jgi:MFS family permease
MNSMHKNAKPIATHGTLKLHPDVVKLGLVSLLTDLSSEMIFSVFAIFFTTIAGASAALLGLVEGCADFAASSLNYLSGWLSDKTGKRKVYVVAGYGFSTLAKLILLLSTAIMAVAAFRVIERLGKSFRGPARDAWLSSVAEKSNRGYAFGVHKALDKTGAVFGPLIAYGLLWCLGDDAASFQILFALALVPAILSVILLSRMKDQPGVKHQRENIFATWQILSPQFKLYLIPSAIFALAYFSFGFLLLRAHSLGFTVKDIVLLYALFNVAFVITAPLVGVMGDSIGRGRIILLGYLVYMLICLGFAYADSKLEIIVLFVIYGLFFAIDEAQSKAFIADIEADRRATAIGLYNFVTGMAYLPASLIAGLLWLSNPASAFFLAASLALLAMVTFSVLRPDKVR